ncbi:MAG: amino acid permease [Longimicrobiales bacterium]|nr:amino acid permease [Longimicrobiales bacterium]
MTRAKALGLWTAVALVVGNMVGSGAYLVPSALGRYGPISLVGWTLTAAGAICLALVFGRLGRIMPAEGGPYAYTRSAFGDLPAFLVAWGYWVSVWVGNAAIATAFVAYLTPFVPSLDSTPVAQAAVALGAVWLLTAVNVWGLREAALLQLVTTVLKVLPLLALATLGLVAVDAADFRPFNVSGGSGLSAVTATAALTLWGLLGLESVTIPADEVENPRRTIPLATVAGTAATAAVYVLSTVAVFAVVAPGELAGTSAPYAEAATRLWGPWIGRLVAAGAAIAAFGALNGWVLMQGQMPLAPARDGLFPRSFARLSARGTPVFGLVLSSCLTTVLVLANYARGLVGLFVFATLLATVTVLASYLGAAAAHVVFILRDPARFGGRGARAFLVVSALAFVYSAWAVVGAGWDAVLWGMVLFVLGVPIYLQGVGVRSRAAAQAAAARGPGGGDG